MAFNQPLKGLIEPSASSWRSAAEADRKALYEEAGKLAVKEKRSELSRAIGANGRSMKRRKRPRRDGANGPVLTPHDAASRSSRLLAARSWAGGVTLFWHAGLGKGQKTPWGSILAFHARGAGPLPVRDVRLSRRGVRAVRKAVETWWAERMRMREKATEPAPAPAGKPGLLGRIKSTAVHAFGKLKGAFSGSSRASAAKSEHAAMLERYPNLRPFLLLREPK